MPFFKTDKLMRDLVKKIESAPVLSETARVISKLHEKAVEGSFGFTETDNSYFIVVEFLDKQREKFAVTPKQYALVLEGETGVLSYKKLEVDNERQASFLKQAKRYAILLDIAEDIIFDEKLKRAFLFVGFRLNH
ncbi:MAG: DUF2500 family protein [Oscillospiraceae bacterium]|nr:DUF2500 family protein [Oscillospiraceae bacterium]